MARPSRQDTYRVAVKIAGNSTGIWDKMTGGEVDSDETKYKPGGMVAHISLGGTKTTGNLVISRIYDLDRDHPLSQELINYVGRVTVTVTKQPLDIDGNVFGDPIVYNGKLKRVTFPEVDSESSNAGMIEIEVTTDGFPAGA